MDTRCDVRLAITRHHFHHHASSVLNEHPTLDDLLQDSIAGEHSVVCQIRKERSREYLGVNAKSLNRTLRESFQRTRQWRYEATVRDGFIADSEGIESKVEGFDFARYDEVANLANLWSACFGRRPLRDGERIWREVAPRSASPQVVDQVRAMGIEGEDLHVERRSPTILGEIQFGNWALAYRDIMKLLAATTEVEVDLFVYVVADGELASMISGGTVNFERFYDILRDFSAVVRVPTWMIGFDLQPGSVPTLEALTQPQ